MKRALVSLLATIALSAQAQTTITVDANLNRHPINPQIYGVAYATTAQLQELNIPLNREGGNATSRYNWLQNASNHANDFYFESLSEGTAAPGEMADTFINSAKAAGAEASITVPLIPWIAKLGPSRGKLASFSSTKYGAQTDCDFLYFPIACNGILSSNGQFVAGNDPNDAHVANTPAIQQSWIQHLVTTFNTSAAGGVRYYAMDNEVSIWHSTHRDVHPVGATMDEIRDAIVNYAGAVKNVDPGAMTLAPEEYGWYGYFFSGYDQQYTSINGYAVIPDRAAHGGADYVPYLLSQLKLAEAAQGRRLTLHYYPSSGEFGNDVTAAMQARRNRSTREFWDLNYISESSINENIRLIPRMKDWVATWYPGTGIGDHRVQLGG